MSQHLFLSPFTTTQQGATSNLKKNNNNVIKYNSTRERNEKDTDWMKKKYDIIINRYYK